MSADSSDISFREHVAGRLQLRSVRGGGCIFLRKLCRLSQRCRRLRQQYLNISSDVGMIDELVIEISKVCSMKPKQENAPNS